MPHRAPGAPGKTRQNYLSGKPIRYYRPKGSADIRQLIDEGFQAFNAGRLSEACQIFSEKMLLPENDTTIGAMTKIQAEAYITAYSTLEDSVFIAPCVVTTNDNYMGRTEKRLSQLRGKWLLVSIDSGRCDESCNRKLLYMRQLRLTQGKNTDRVERVWLISDGAVPPAEVAKEYEGTWLARPGPDLTYWRRRKASVSRS